MDRYLEVKVILVSVEKFFTVNDKNFQKVFDDAVFLIEKQEFCLAIEKLLEISKIYPGSFEVNYNLGLSYFCVENFENSFDKFQKASENKQIPIPFAVLAESTYKIGKYSISKKAFEKLRTYQINDLETLKVVAGLCMEIERYSESLEYFSKALEMENSNADLLYKIAVIQYKLQKIDLAFNTYLQVIQLDPNNYRALNNLASIYEIKKNFEKAREYYQKSISVCPDYNNAYENLISLNKRLSFEQD